MHCNRFSAAVAAVLMGLGSSVFAGDNATKDDAVKMVKEGIKFIKAQGNE